jgi:sigma-E factor negative regulatory protein RseA
MDKISTLMDGELDDRQAQQEFARLGQNGELRQKWDTFHLIGDALRGERLLLTDIAHALAQRLALEPTVLAPRRGATRKITTSVLSAAASLAAVALVGWLALSTHATFNAQEEVASARPPVIALPVSAPVAAPVAQVANVPDEGRRNEYLLAHQAFSPSTAIQGVVPYIRSVSSRQSFEDR